MGEAAEAYLKIREAKVICLQSLTKSEAQEKLIERFGINEWWEDMRVFRELP